MTYRIASILRHVGNRLFDTAERLHPIDTQPMTPMRTIPLQWAHSNDTLGGEAEPMGMEWHVPAAQG